MKYNIKRKKKKTGQRKRCSGSWQVQEKSTKTIPEMKTKLERKQEMLDSAGNSTRNMGDRNNKIELNKTKMS